MTSLAVPNSSELDNELDCYFCSKVEHVTNPLVWWYKHCTVFLSLSHMALDSLWSRKRYAINLLFVWCQFIHWQDNVFGAMTSLTAPNSSELGNELDCYLCSDVEHVTNHLVWWYEHCTVILSLSCMALDYLTIPSTFSIRYHCNLHSFTGIMLTATSIDVEWLFSGGHSIVTHTHSWLSAQTTCALLCLKAWSILNLVKTEDVFTMAALKDLQGGDVALEDSWDSITLS